MATLEKRTHFMRNYFSKLGLSYEIADMYLALTLKGPQTISELSRSSGVERTRIYRLTDELLASGLIEVESEYKRNIYKAAPFTNVQIKIAKKEQELKELQSGLTDVKDIFLEGRRKKDTRVQFYSGEDGAKQFFWNETKAKSEMLCILYENMQTKTGSRFFDRWVRRCNDRGISFRGIVSQRFIRNIELWSDANKESEHLEKWEARVLPEEEFPITHSTVTYDDVTAYYNWSSSEVFALEIYNQDIARTQKQYFELLWEKAKPVGK